jgi:hypothetical protein
LSGDPAKHEVNQYLMLKLEIKIAFNHYQFVECIITQATSVRAKDFSSNTKIFQLVLKRQVLQGIS